jgi:hypothetical protein
VRVWLALQLSLQDGAEVKFSIALAVGTHKGDLTKSQNKIADRLHF